MIEKVTAGRDNAGGKNDPSACISSNRGSCGRQRHLWAARITPPLMFRVIEEVVVGRDNADGKNN